MNKDNDDIIDVLPGGEESDMSSHYTLISSLEEHSYCASIMSTSSSGAQEHAIGDLFGNSGELCNDDIATSIRFPIGIIEDVNLDGFNYSVPSVIASVGVGGSESMELENMWVGLSSDTSTTTVVEVAATNEEGAVMQQSVDDGVNKTDATDGAPATDLVKDDQNHGFKRVPKSKFRRTDYIVDKKKRENHFDLYFQKLSSDYHRVLSRTGCEGILSATFEGKFYNGKNPKAKSFTNSVVQSNEGSLLLPPSTFVVSANESLASDGMDDHRYAATMITQNIASPAVRDHQYDEKTVAPDSDTTDNDEDSVDSKGAYRFKRENSKRYRYDYIKVKWERTQIFTKLVRTLFTSRKLLEQRTGAEIQLSLEFEGIEFNGENYLNASKIISAHRKHVQSRRLDLLPKTLHTTNPTPLTFILPDFSSFPFQVPYVIPVSSASPIVPCKNFPVRVPVSPTIIPNLTLSNADETSLAFNNVTENFDEIPPDDNNENLDNAPTLALVESKNATTCVLKNEPNVRGEIELIQEVSSINPCTGVSNSFPPAGGGEEMEDQFMAFDNTNMQNSPEVAVARGMKEAATNTEPICSICFSPGDDSNNSSRTNAENSTAKSFWIRCNDPFCYEMVHASCVGFVITHNIHLKQLPAYYCKSHR